MHKDTLTCWCLGPGPAKQEKYLKLQLFAARSSRSYRVAESGGSQDLLPVKILQILRILKVFK